MKKTGARKVAAVGFVAFALLAVMAAPGQAQTINEIRIDQPLTDNDEYIEIKGTPFSELDLLWYVVIGDLPGDPNDNSGVIEAVVPLSGQMIPASGYMVIAESTYTLGTADVVTALNFENSDTVTHLLVEEFTGSIGQDLDINDDGTLDVMPWADILDEVALIEDDPPVDADDEYPYSLIKVGPDGTNVPGHVYRCVDGSLGTWQVGAFATGVDDTPGAENYCGPPLGACCVGPGCNVTTEAACTGTWELHVSCDPLPCGPTGSCCEPDFFCTDGVTEPECAFQDPLADWVDGGTCEVNCIAPLGSCCLPDGTCATGYTEVQCLSEDGYQWTDGASSCTPPCSLTPAPVIISEYYESAPGNRKAVEIYNTSPDPQSLNGHRLVLYANASTSPTSSYVLNGITMPGHSVLVFINNVDDDIPGFDETSAIVTGVCSFNGNDALKILFGDPGIPQVVDAFAIAGDPADGPRGDFPYMDAAWEREDAVLVGTDDFDACNFDGEIGCTLAPCPPGTPVQCPPGTHAGEWVFEGLNPSGDNGNHTLGWHFLALPTGACCFDTSCTPQQTVGACVGGGGVYQGDGTACEPNNPCVPATGACCIDEICTIVEGAGNCTGTYVGDYSDCVLDPCQPQTLIISEVVDGTFPNGEPKFIEITNMGGALVALDDYRVALYSNGSLTENANSLGYGDLAGLSIAAGGSFVIANSNSGPGDSFFAIFAREADFYASVANSNGDDVYELLKDAGGGNDLLIDVHGEKGVDGTGTPWEYLDSYANRLSGITSGNQTFTLAEWCHPGVDVLEDPDGENEEFLMQLLLTPGSHGGGTLGACCRGGACTQETEAACQVGGGIYGGDCTVCSPNPCGGACCVAADDCRTETAAGCGTLGGNFLGLGSECSPNPCGGACCNGADCTVETAETCLLVIEGDYKGDGVECLPVNPCQGACCVGPECEVRTEAVCTALEGTYIGDGTDCAISPCQCLTEAEAEPPNLPAPSGVVLCEMVISSTTDLVNSSTYKNFFAQDATGGITVFGTVERIDEVLNGPDGLPGTGDEVGEGDSVKLSGTTDEYNGLFELADPPPTPPAGALPLAVLEQIGSPGIPAPIVIGLSDMQVSSPTAEGLESMLVDLQAVWFIDGDGNMQFAYGNWTVTDDSGLTATVRVATESLNLIGHPIPTGTVNVTGMFSQYDTTDPYDGGYQLMPRTISDVVEIVSDCGTCLGDVDAVVGDGNVDTGDIIGMVEALLGLTSRPCADVNDDTWIDGRDVAGFIALVLANAGAGTPCVTGPSAREISACGDFIGIPCDDGNTNGWCRYEVLNTVVPGGVTQCADEFLIFPGDQPCVPCDTQCDDFGTVQTFKWINADGVGTDCYFEAQAFQAIPTCEASCGPPWQFNDVP